MAIIRFEGWWEQSGLGRQPMHNLMIEFVNDQLEGNGDDLVGSFVLSGHLQGDQIAIRKQYLGKHVIDYHGKSEGEGIYSGDWSFGGLVGGKWWIRARSIADGSANAITEIRHA